MANGETSFSRLKIVKNYLRSTMSQERLVNLSIIANENDVCIQIEINNIVSIFSVLKARKVNL